MKTVTNRSHASNLTVKIAGKDHGYKKYSWGLHHPTFGPLKDTQFNSKSEMKSAMEKHPAYNPSLNEAKDKKEYGYEGEMAKSQLKGVMMHAKQLHDMLEPDTDLPEWVQSKITLAYDYIQTAADYMATELDEEMSPQEAYHRKHGYYSFKLKAPSVDDAIGHAMNTITAKYGKGKKATPVKEEAPTNSASGGNIAGIGVGPKGEPGVKPKAMKRYKDKNAAEAPKAGRKTFSLFMKGE
jgi:hypothetical protein